MASAFTIFIDCILLDTFIGYLKSNRFVAYQTLKIPAKLKQLYPHMAETKTGLANGHSNSGLKIYLII